MQHEIPGDVCEYIMSLGLNHLHWKTGHPENNTDFALLIIKSHDEQLRLSLGKASGISFMEADDLSWAGPIRYVAAWAEISI